MADVLPSQLMSSVMGKLYDVLTNGDDTVPQSEDNFFSWATPGIPVDESEFEFLTQGLTGIVKKRAIEEMMVPVGAGAGGGDGTATATATAPALTATELEALRAQDTQGLYMQAENFARMVDFVPDVTRPDNQQFTRLSVMNNEGSLSDIYRYILRMSQVAKTELEPETKAKVEEFRKLLTSTTIKKDLIDGTEKEVSGPSPLVTVYNEKMAAYEDAVLTYNNARIDAMTASDARAVHNWAINANVLRNRVRAAMNDWVSNGYKNEYEAITAYINQVMMRDMALLKEEYRDDLEKARLTSPTSGSDFFFTSLVPGNFAKSSGWTEFRFNSGSFETHASSNYSTKKWKASGRAGWLGIFGGSGGGGSSSSESEYKTSFKTENFSLSFQIAQVPIVKEQWFKTPFMMSQSWRFDQNNAEAKGQLISDGATPPRGMMPAYPTAVIFVRNLHLKFGESSGFSDWMAQQTSTTAGGGGFVRWGAFAMGGSYNRNTSSGSTQFNHGYKFENQEMLIPGMTVAGYKCHIVDEQRPKPLPTIEQWI
jgi:hypothetical protein